MAPMIGAATASLTPAGGPRRGPRGTFDPRVDDIRALHAEQMSDPGHDLGVDGREQPLRSRDGRIGVVDHLLVADEDQGRTGDP